MAVLLNVIPKRYSELNISSIDTYFAMARGYQKNDKDVKALRMKKWFNTNYHNMVPEIDDSTEFSLNDAKPYDLYKEAKELDIITRPVIIGPFTFLKLSRLKTIKTFEECLEKLVDVYIEILNKFENHKVEWVQIDEPILATDLTKEDIELFKCTEKMQVSSQAFQNIIDSTTKKMDAALTEGKIIRISCGHYTTKICKFKCLDCEINYD
ncbi:hypothetical protein CBU02nite_22540 [Clostridium butyricum]|uniref:Cobalamin-independent methionine synthase MetE N-terminal domain-containing protein n=1 Tax=Clostridium butyricum TaxID=1492 RepID=A0A512TP46_CLOBU|nr:putative DNA-binding protein (UPF0251 family) [Clostridium butyricum]GEQ21748.1 hypothetical protein CBU02nite_22540 [Clostridium butyricum]